MHIAHVVPRGEQAASGVLTVVVELASALARRGHDVDLWRLHPWTDASYGPALERLRDAGVVLRDDATEVPRRRVGKVVAVGVGRQGAQVVHIHGAYNVWNTMVTRALKIPYVFSPHSGYDPVSLRRSRFRKALYNAAFERPMLRRAKVCVGLTGKEAEDLRLVGARGDVSVIPNGVRRVSGTVDRNALRRELDLDPATRLALFVGRLDVYRKGLDALLFGISEAPEWHLALVGPDFRDGLRKIRALVTELSIETRVHLLGARHGELLELAYEGADLLVLPSRWEGLSMSLLEGMAHGLPVLVSPTIENALSVEKAGAGWSATHDDLGRTLLKLTSIEGTDWARAQRDARAFAGRYNWDHIARQYEQVYEAAVTPREAGV